MRSVNHGPLPNFGVNPLSSYCFVVGSNVVRINSSKECIFHSLSNIHGPRPQRAAPSRSHNTLPPSRRRESSPVKGARLPKVAPIACILSLFIAAPIYIYYRTSSNANFTKPSKLDLDFEGGRLTHFGLLGSITRSVCDLPATVLAENLSDI